MKIKLKINSDGKPLQKPNNDLSNKNKRDLSFEEYSKEIAVRCKTYLFLEWENKTTYKKVKSYYNKMLTVSDAISFIILS